MTDSDLVRWRAAQPGCIAWAHCGNRVVAYHRPSGKTHFLNDASYALLSDVLGKPRTLEEIAHTMFGGDDDAPDAFVEQLYGQLDRFEQIGLVYRT